MIKTEVTNAGLKRIMSYVPHIKDYLDILRNFTSQNLHMYILGNRKRIHLTILLHTQCGLKVKGTLNADLAMAFRKGVFRYTLLLYRRHKMD